MDGLPIDGFVVDGFAGLAIDAPPPFMLPLPIAPLLPPPAVPPPAPCAKAGTNAPSDRMKNPPASNLDKHKYLIIPLTPEV